MPTPLDAYARQVGKAPATVAALLVGVSVR